MKNASSNQNMNVSGVSESFSFFIILKLFSHPQTKKETTNFTWLVDDRLQIKKGWDLFNLKVNLFMLQISVH